MATAPYFEFEFPIGPTGSTFTDRSATDTTAATFAVPGGPGINFTWSVSAPGLMPTNLLAHSAAGSAFDTFDGALTGTVCGTSPSTPNDNFTLGLTNSNDFLVGTVANPLELDFYTVIGSWTVTWHLQGGGSVFQSVGTTATTGGGSLVSVFNPSLILHGAREVSHITFTTTTVGGVIVIDDLKAAIQCYLEGTRIEAEDGMRAVEDLRPGDKLRRADGALTEVKWVGQQDVPGDVLHPAKVNPIRISAGALGPNVPNADLYLSPDHAIEIDGMLVNAGALVNGQTILQVRQMPKGGFTYYHVETEAHEVILAEGCPAESYLDLPDRSMFANGAGRADAPAIKEMDLPRISSQRLVPQEIKARLARRAPKQVA